jgi:hypothetical protein
MTNRIRQFEDAQWPVIIPVEDEMQIVHGPARFAGGECVMVESPTWRNANEVEVFVNDRTKKEYIMPIPSRITGEFKDFTQGNPHKNGKGYWVWLLVTPFTNVKRWNVKG